MKKPLVVGVLVVGVAVPNPDAYAGFLRTSGAGALVVGAPQAGSTGRASAHPIMKWSPRVQKLRIDKFEENADGRAAGA